MSDTIQRIEKDVHHQLDLVNRNWKLYGILIGIAIALYTTVQDVRAHSRWIDRADRVLFATFMNSMLACVRSGSTDCVTPDMLERGEFTLEMPDMRIEGKDPPK